MIQETLKKLGLTDNEITLYLALLKEGTVASGHIIKKTGFQSSVVYHLLNSLIEKGFVSFVTEKKKKLFSASDPQLLYSLIDIKEKELSDLKLNFKSSLKELESMKASSKPQTKITVYSGIKGLQTIFNDILENTKEIKTYSARNNFAKAMPKYREYFKEMRLAKKIKQKSIITDNERKPNETFQEKRYVPKKYSSPVGLELYNDKVVVFIWDSQPPIALVLQGEKVSVAFSNMFETMWKQAKN